MANGPLFLRKCERFSLFSVPSCQCGITGTSFSAIFRSDLSLNGKGDWGRRTSLRQFCRHVKKAKSPGEILRGSFITCVVWGRVLRGDELLANDGGGRSLIRCLIAPTLSLDDGYFARWPSSPPTTAATAAGRTDGDCESSRDRPNQGSHNSPSCCLQIETLVAESPIAPERAPSEQTKPGAKNF
jgi:hypothetical protein